MKIVIFGAGDLGRVALFYFGRNRVSFFVDNIVIGKFWGKPVLSLEELISIYTTDYLIAITPKEGREEIQKQLEDCGIQNFFVFKPYDLVDMQRWQPEYWLNGRGIHPDYTEALSFFDIENYEKIGVIFDKYTFRYAHYFWIELKARNDKCQVKVFIDCKSEDVEEFPLFKLCQVSEQISDLDSCQAVVINAMQSKSSIREHIFGERQTVYDLFDIEDYYERYQHPELSRYHNIHRGKRCFIIGTGPSLTIEDLDTLAKHQEICIACNKVYRAYDRTKWRADYYGFLDGKVIEDCIADLDTIPGEVFIGDSYNYEYGTKMKDVQYFHYKNERFFPNIPRFSKDFTKGFYSGATTTYSFGIQLAAYMGFSKIYLLGVDNNVVGNCSSPQNHFISDYYTNDEQEKYQNSDFNKDALDKAYEGAEYYSRKLGFRIFNATRGGCLEAFERVNFDDLFR